eukprot:TRINITY_DN902_c0_g1_i1.p1 TRINITY_DN902_c0_g1~~TRINITY_DN902_c0_g1_i1.p1  ORF type:complete len:122 (-),score=1.87 TRINITY_DN902_c0_g1_i1:15-380(-)
MSPWCRLVCGEKAGFDHLFREAAPDVKKNDNSDERETHHNDGVGPKLNSGSVILEKAKTAVARALGISRGVCSALSVDGLAARDGTGGDSRTGSCWGGGGGHLLSHHFDELLLFGNLDQAN